MGVDIAQLVERRTGTLLKQVRFSGAAKELLPESTFSADSLTMSVHSRVKPQALASVRTSNIL